MDDASTTFRVALAQVPISGDARVNGDTIRTAMRRASEAGARLVQLPEGALSGYAKNPITDWAEVDWGVVRSELESIMRLAAELELWVVLGSAHPLSSPRLPHNSVYVISDAGQVVDRYDKRRLSHTEVTEFYTAGSEPVVFDIDGYRFGLVVCVEINFPELFIEYAGLGVDCLLFSSYPVDSVFAVKARAYAAIHCYWVSMTNPSETSTFCPSSVFGPNGDILATVDGAEGVVTVELDRDAPEFDIALTKARPWRASVPSDPAYDTRSLDDPRSRDRTCL
ncbi:Predicted amidohydrolase [Nocardioides alpinus]|uniref:Carbon-nitrogen hydrolase family protein n=1 Tax=Nocardioides alpinus TaxID=748909 RepID=A0A1I1B6X5_9ACTN|nr:carbon-nitrogen hydrolase family protein [Nocardioides alpinus]PKH41291.1 carbon-nitrogen hydrolase family protein [Nocardioides alpinus]SFB46089.1 Predicted amidohydrolase [Nocardioides alpinus]